MIGRIVRLICRVARPRHATYLGNLTNAEIDRHLAD